MFRSRGKWKSLSHVQLFATPRNSPWNSVGQNTRVGSLSLLQGVFPIQGSNPVLPHCRQIFYQLSHQGSTVADFFFFFFSFSLLILSCHSDIWFHLNLVKVKVTPSCPTVCCPVDYAVHEILQAWILELVAFPFSRGSSQPRDWTQVLFIVGRFFTSWATRGAQEY